MKQKEKNTLISTFEKVYDYLEKHPEEENGICVVLNLVSDIGTYDAQITLKYLSENKPLWAKIRGKFFTAYWWHPSNVNARKRWIKKQIKKLKK